ncbi:MAG: hypothetical protein HY899_03005, partial [Deltaproteobacteria bacterium]|nr:hypothetical protein [Deltaproteobacteria bacterium]
MRSRIDSSLSRMPLTIIGGAALAWFLPLSSPAFASAIVAQSADDICGPQDDPCLITRPVKVTGNRALDFGVRSVLVSRAGRFDFGADGGAIRC